jgi:hypothetical protein
MGIDLSLPCFTDELHQQEAAAAALYVTMEENPN